MRISRYYALRIYQGTIRDSDCRMMSRSQMATVFLLVSGKKRYLSGTVVCLLGFRTILARGGANFTRMPLQWIHIPRLVKLCIGSMLERRARLF